MCVAAWVYNVYIANNQQTNKKTRFSVCYYSYIIKIIDMLLQIAKRCKYISGADPWGGVMGKFPPKKKS